MRTKDMARRRLWITAPRSEKPAAIDDQEKRAIVAACEAFIRNVLKPRFLPEIRPTEWNYPIDILGAWAGGRYRFMQRYRSGMDHNRGEEFDAPFRVSIASDVIDSISIGCGTQANGGGSTPASRLPKRFALWRQTVSCIHTDRGRSKRAGVSSSVIASVWRRQS
jgi:hypothetical protein